MALGPVPVEGDDETFKNGFTIHAEKCPNRRGVEEIIRHVMGRAPTIDEVVVAAEAGELRRLWASGGYKSDWIDEAAADRLAAVPLVVVQDLFTSPLSDRATFVLPGAAFAEREGSYVNHAGWLQSVPWAIRPPAGVRVELGLYGQLLAMPGMVKARRVLDDIAREIPYFAAASEPIGPLGVGLGAGAAVEAAGAK